MRRRRTRRRSVGKCGDALPRRNLYARDDCPSGCVAPSAVCRRVVHETLGLRRGVRPGTADRGTVSTE